MEGGFGPEGTMAIRVLLADDHPLMRAGVRAALSLEGDLEVVGEAGNGHEAIAIAKQLLPDVVVLDLHMPRVGGLAALPALVEQVPSAKVVVLTSEEHESVLFQVLRAGGSGYVLKRAAETELVSAIRQAAAGKAFVRPPIQDLLAASVQAEVDAGRPSEAYERLTPREKEVLSWLARGLTNPQVAEKLDIGARTVETHRAHLMGKLGLQDRAELVAYALAKGYLA